MKQEFEGFDFTNFWDDNYYARKEYISDAPTDELIADVEKELGYKLPTSYIWLMKQHNGASLSIHASLLIHPQIGLKTILL